MTKKDINIQLANCGIYNKEQIHSSEGIGEDFIENAAAVSGGTVIINDNKLSSDDVITALLLKIDEKIGFIEGVVRVFVILSVIGFACAILTFCGSM